MTDRVCGDSPFLDYPGRGGGVLVRVDAHDFGVVDVVRQVLKERSEYGREVHVVEATTGRA